MITLAEHTFEESLLTGGVVIDAGCVGFAFTKAIQQYAETVYAFDLEDMEAPPRVRYITAAIMNYTGKSLFHKTPDRQAWNIGFSGNPENKVDCIDINLLYGLLDGNVDLLKLDIEGSEYYILSDKKFRPVPKQISVEFHKHSVPHLHNDYYELCMNNLLEWYKPVKHEMSEAHGCGMNYWDSLFIRKDLL